MTISISGGVQITHSNAKTSATTAPFLFSNTYIKASNTGLSDIFGNAVDVDDDTLVVGAPQEDSNATTINGDQSNNTASERGAVYVFRLNKTTGTWSQEAYIKCPESVSRFGNSVAISGDTLVVSTINQPVYVFTRSGTTWTYSQKLTPTQTHGSGLTGCRVALDGDLLVVGQSDEASTTSGINPSNNFLGTARGAAWVWRRSGGTFSQEVYIKEPTSSESAYFGWDVDVDEATNSIIVGAFGSDPSAVSNAGRAYVYNYSGGSWALQQTLTASTIGSNDFFGYAVSISGDLACVSAPFEDSNATGIGGDQSNDSASSSGAVYLFKRTSGTWSQTHYLKSSNSEAGDQFGVTCKIRGNKVVVGANAEDGNGTGLNPSSNNTGTSTGAAYLFSYDGVNCSQTYYIKPTVTQNTQYFGGADYFNLPFNSSVALTNGIVVVGAYLENSSTTGINPSKNTSATGSGAVFCYNLW